MGEIGVIVIFCHLFIIENLENTKSRKKEENDHQSLTPQIHCITINGFLLAFFKLKIFEFILHAKFCSLLFSIRMIA